MEHKQRNKRLRLLVSKVNKARKRQAKKIDILCNDLIAEHRNFIKKLSTINFEASFYETILGTTDLKDLLHIAGKIIKDRITEANVAFFLRQQDNFELHRLESSQPSGFEKQRLENCFNNELVDNICKSNKICTLNCLLAMGLNGNPAMLNKISVATIPMGQFGMPGGFILIYRSCENELTEEELNNVATIIPGLSHAIQSCQTLSHIQG
jgi:hypothetical protein